MSINRKLGVDSACGFTLIEVLAALSIMMIGIVGAFGLISQTLSASNTASMQLTAAYLGKEGIEIVKSIRDGNYLKIHYGESGYDGVNSWMSGLAAAGDPVSVNCSAAAGCGADYGMNRLYQAYASQNLKFDGSFYNYTSGSGTVFRRIIRITPQAGHLNVIVEIKWSEKGTNHSFVAQENIYNWWPM